MAQSLSKLYVHLVFSTKDRRDLIQKDLKNELHSYVAGILLNHDSHAININSVSDHIHILFNLSRTQTLSKIVGTIKTSTTCLIKEKGLTWCGWQSGYGAFSVSESQLQIVNNYISNQEKHHQTLSFQDELRELLRKHNIEFDEKYVWD